MKYIPFLLIILLLLCGCSPSQPQEDTEPAAPVIATTLATEPTEPPTEPPDPVEELLATMTTEEKVGQLFLARCPEENAAGDVAAYHLGGYILFARDFENETPETLTKTLESYQSAAKVPLLIAVDEEGGDVCRVSLYSAFRHSPFESPRELYELGGLELALSLESEKAILLHSLGINVNMAPVCDISTQRGAFLYRRSLGQSPEITADFVRQTVARMAEYQVGTVLKHFPGYGNNADTHTGIVVDGRTLEELENADLIPFAAGIEADCGAVLVGHIIVNALDETYPASLSPAVHSYLRQNMGFNGVIVTDDLVMEAITDTYGPGEAAVLAVLAGNDLLCCTDYPAQYPAVLEAVESGRIPLELLDAAVTRVLRWKQNLGLI